MGTPLSPEELRFQETLQAVFGPRCAEFGEGLRDALRQLYTAAWKDGQVKGTAMALAGEKPVLDPGTDLDHFNMLSEGLHIQNSYLRSQGQVRMLLSASFQSVVLQAATGDPATKQESFSRPKFNTYSPYWVVAQPAKKGSAA